MGIRQAGPGVGLLPNYPYATPYRGLAGQQTTIGAGSITLAPGEAFVLPAGGLLVQPGPYTTIQHLDPVTQTWRIFATGGEARHLDSDGANLRLVNIAGCAAGALITNAGSGYTSTPTVTPSAGNSTWRAIVGGAVDTTVTVGTAGTGYTYAPQVVFSPPPAGGVQATGYATLSSDGVGTVVVTNQGAGYTSAPSVTFVRDARDTGGVNAAATTTLTGDGSITAILCTGHGTAVTSVPTLTISGGGGASGAATAVMAFAVTGFTVGAGGAGYGNAQPFAILGVGGVVSGTPGAVVNPALDKAILTPRLAVITGTTSAGGAVQTTGAVIADPGLFQAVPQGVVMAGGSGLATTTAQVTLTVGGAADTSIVQPF